MLIVVVVTVCLSFSKFSCAWPIFLQFLILGGGYRRKASAKPRGWTPINIFLRLSATLFGFSAKISNLLQFPLPSKCLKFNFWKIAKGGVPGRAFFP